MGLIITLPSAVFVLYSLSVPSLNMKYCTNTLDSPVHKPHNIRMLSYLSCKRITLDTKQHEGFWSNNQTHLRNNSCREYKLELEEGN